MENNIKDFNQIKKSAGKKKRKKRGKKNFLQSKYIFAGAIVLTVLVVLIAGFCFSTDKIIEGDDVSSENGELLSTVTSDEMGFPVTFSNNDIIISESFSSHIFVLGKKILTCVSAEGKIKYNKIFAFTKPQMAVSDKYGIVYDAASASYFIFNSRGVIYEGETENKKHIICAEINNRGDIALVTRSEDSACRVCVVDKKGNVNYIWSCADEYVVAVDLSSDGKEILCGAVGSENGSIYSKLYLLDVYSDKEKAEYHIESSAVIDVLISGRKLIATCNEGRYTFNKNSDNLQPQTVAEYTSKIIGYSSDSNGNTAIVTNKVGSFGTNEITVYNKNNDISYRGYTDEGIIDVLCRGKKVYLLCDTAIYESLSDGTFEKTSTQEISGEGMVICKSRMYYYSVGQIDVNS